MAHTVTITRAYCDDHLAECYQAHDSATGQTKCIDYLTETTRLKTQGYIYTGHHAGQYTYTLRKSAPLALPIDWQIAIEERPEYVDVDQDW